MEKPTIEMVEKRWQVDGHLDDWDTNWIIQKAKMLENKLKEIGLILQK